MASFAPHQFQSIAPEYDELFQFRAQDAVKNHFSPICIMQIDL